MNVEIAQVFTQILSFLIVLWVLKRFAWKPFLKILEDREENIRSQFATIEKQKKENADLLQDYQGKIDNASKEVRELIKQGRESGLQAARKIEDEAHEEAKKMVLRTKEELQKEVEKAKLELRNELVNMTFAATEKMVKVEMNPEKQKEMISQFLNESAK